MGRHSFIKKMEVLKVDKLAYFCNCKGGTITEADEPGAFEIVETLEDGVCVHCGYYAVSQTPQFYNGDEDGEADEEYEVHLDYIRL